MNDRRRHNLPKAYRRGFQNFYGRDFIVTRDVLIPRPETEQMIDAVLNLAGKAYLPGVKPSISKLPNSPKILEIGTGSGCVAITLKLELKEAKIRATDISRKALKIAQKNAEKFAVADPNLFIISNLLKNVKFTSENKPDLLIANLPYVDKKWSWLDRKSLKYEPKKALFAKDGGLRLIKKLIDQASNQRIKFLILEADPSQHQIINAYALEKDYELIEKRGFIVSYSLRA